MLSIITKEETVRKIYLTSSRTHEKKADKIAQRLGKVRLEVVKDWMGRKISLCQYCGLHRRK